MDASPGYGLQVAENSAGQVLLTGMTGNDTVVNVTAVGLGLTQYSLDVLAPAGGKSLTVGALAGDNVGALVTELAGGNTVTFGASDLGQDYYYVNGAGDKAVLQGDGDATLVLPGTAANYAVSYDGSGTLTLKDSVGNRNGTLTVAIQSGSGQINFADGSVIGLGSSTYDAVAYGGTGVAYGGTGNDTFDIGNGVSTVNGGGGTNAASFYVGDFDASFGFAASAGSIVVTGGQ